MPEASDDSRAGVSDRHELPSVLGARDQTQFLEQEQYMLLTDDLVLPPFTVFNYFETVSQCVTLVVLELTM